MEIPEFFIPGVEADNVEEALKDLAALAGCDVPPVDRRVYCIEWRHDSDHWTAQVGSQLKGARPPGKSRRTPDVTLRDPATVQAILPGVPWMVVTDKRPVGKAFSEWENPFMVGEPRRVVYFKAGG